MINLLLILSGIANCWAAWRLLRSTNRTKGPGSWAEDRARTMLAGAGYVFGLVCFAIVIANLIAP